MHICGDHGKTNKTCLEAVVEEVAVPIVGILAAAHT